MKEGTAGCIYLIAIGLLLAGVGAVFTWLLGASFAQARAMDEWVATPCLILESELRERQIGPEVPVDYSFGLLFGYELGGESYSSDHHSLRGNAWVKEAAKIEALRKDFPAGSTQTCYVNPKNPELAVLKKETKAPGYTIWFPILFVVGGLGIVVRAVWTLFRPIPKAPLAP